MSIKEEQFDELIRKKYIEDEEEEELVWDKSKVWQTMQPKKQRNLSYFKYAASFAIFIGIGLSFFVFLSQEKTKKASVLSPKFQKKSIDEFTNIKPIKEKQKQLIYKKNKVKNSTTEPVLAKKVENITIISTQEGTVNAIFETKSDVILQQETSIEAVNKTIQSPPTSNVIVLNIPISEDDGLKRKKRVIGRFFQQMSRYSNGEKFDWQEVNIKPKKIWAYFKNSFMADSTTIY